MKRFGGPNTLRRPCVRRACTAIVTGDGGAANPAKGAAAAAADLDPPGQRRASHRPATVAAAAKALAAESGGRGRQLVSAATGAEEAVERWALRRRAFEFSAGGGVEGAFSHDERRDMEWEFRRVSHKAAQLRRAEEKEEKKGKERAATGRREMGALQKVLASRSPAYPHSSSSSSSASTSSPTTLSHRLS